MKTETIQKNVQALAEFAESKSTLPILSHVLVNQLPDKLTLSVTDLECSMRVSSNGMHDEKVFNGCIDVRVLKNALSGETGELHLSPYVDDETEKLGILFNGSRYDVSPVSQDEYPSLPSENPQSAAITLDAKEFRARLSQVIPFIGHDESRYVICGALFEIDAHNLRMVGTDGHALGYSEIYLKEHISQAQTLFPKKDSAIFHRRSLEKLLKVVKLLNPETVTISRGRFSNDIATDDAIINFSFCANDSAVSIFLRTISGVFPNYRQVIPQHTAQSPFEQMRLDCDLLALALKKIEKMGGGCIIDLDSKQIETSSPEFGRLRISLPDDCYTGSSKHRLGIAAKLLKQALAAFKGDEGFLTLSFNDPQTPYVVRNKDESIAEMTVVIMPLRLK